MENKQHPANYGKYDENDKQVNISIEGKPCFIARIKAKWWDSLLEELKDTPYSDRSKWIKAECKKEFGIDIKKRSDMILFDAKLEEHYYDGRADWLRDKARDMLNIKKSNTGDEGEM